MSFQSSFTRGDGLTYSVVERSHKHQMFQSSFTRGDGLTNYMSLCETEATVSILIYSRRWAHNKSLRQGQCAVLVSILIYSRRWAHLLVFNGPCPDKSMFQSSFTRGDGLTCEREPLPRRKGSRFQSSFTRGDGLTSELIDGMAYALVVSILIYSRRWAHTRSVPAKSGVGHRFNPHLLEEMGSQQVFRAGLQSG